MSDLNHAIVLIRQGRKVEAQGILQGLIKADPRNIQAWFWYVETCDTNAQRTLTLEACLKLNPGNPQVTQALQKLRELASSASAQSVSSKPATPPTYSHQEEPPSKRTDDLYDIGSFSSARSTKAPLYKDERPVSTYQDDMGAYGAFGSASDAAQSLPPQKKPWEDPANFEDQSMLSKPSKRPIRTYGMFDVWLTATTVQDVDSYEDLLKDPEAGLDRAFMWMALAGLVNAVIFPLILLIDPRLSELTSMSEFQSLTGGSASSLAVVGVIFAVLLIGAPIGNILNLAIGGGIQHLMAMLFGGGGSYTRTIYALASFLAPMTILTTLISLVPVVGQCLAVPLSFYNLVLNVRALRAAHSISTGAAVGAIFAPGILLIILGCLLVFLVSGTGFSS